MSEQVLALLAERPDDPKLADLIEAAAPRCACEEICLGVGTPGPVRSDEMLHRILASPRDFDPDTGTILETPFYKAYKNGLSVWRAVGEVEDVVALMRESLWRTSAAQPETSIFGVLIAQAADVRSIVDRQDERCFCIYDQTVPREKCDTDLKPVPTHASIFMRTPPKGTVNRDALRKDMAGRLREVFEKQFTSADGYYDGVCTDLNARAKAGEFIG